MTVYQAYVVAAVVLPYAAVLGAVIGRAVYLHLAARHVCRVGESERLSPAVNRQAARSAVSRRDWAESDHQSWPKQSARIDRPGLHRLDKTR